MINNIPVIGSVSAGFGNSAPGLPDLNATDPVAATQDFVAVLYSYMFEQMRSGSDEEGGLFSGEHSGMFMGFLDQEIGKQLSRGEGSNLASQLLTQLAGDKQTPELAKAKAAAQNNLLSDMARDPRVQAQQMLEEINKINRS